MRKMKSTLAPALLILAIIILSQFGWIPDGTALPTHYCPGGGVACYEICECPDGVGACDDSGPPCCLGSDLCAMTEPGPHARDYVSEIWRITRGKALPNGMRTPDKIFAKNVQSQDKIDWLPQLHDIDASAEFVVRLGCNKSYSKIPWDQGGQGFDSSGCSINDLNDGVIGNDPSIPNWPDTSVLINKPQFAPIYWQIQPINGGTFAPLGDWSGVNLQGAWLDLPVVKVPVIMQWDTFTGAVSYNLVWGPDRPRTLQATQNNEVLEGLSEANKTITVLPKAIVYWAIQGIDVQGNVIAGAGRITPYWYTYDATTSFTDAAKDNVRAPKSYFYAVPGTGVNVGKHFYRRSQMGGAPQHQFLTWGKIPGAVEYQVETGTAALPSDLEFKEGLSSVPVYDASGQVSVVVSMVTQVYDCAAACGLDAASDREYNAPGFQYSFPTPHASNTKVFYRVRGIDQKGNVITRPTAQYGPIQASSSTIGYSSVGLTWPEVPNATSYVVDLVRADPDFSDFPVLTLSDLQQTAQSGLVKMKTRSSKTTVGGNSPTTRASPSEDKQVRQKAIKPLKNAPSKKKMLNTVNRDRRAVKALDRTALASQFQYGFSLSDSPIVFRRMDVKGYDHPWQASAQLFADEIALSRISQVILYRAEGFDDQTVNQFAPEFETVFDMVMDEAASGPSYVESIAPKLVGSLIASVTISETDPSVLEVVSDMPLVDKSYGGASITITQTGGNVKLLQFGGSSGVFRLELQLGHNEKFLVSLPAVKAAPNYRSYIAKGLVPGEYYWRVRPRTAHAFGPWSQIRKIDLSTKAFPQQDVIWLQSVPPLQAQPANPGRKTVGN